MTSSAAIQTEDVTPMVALTVSRDVQNFDLLIEDMETELGEAWGDLSFDDARVFFKQPDSDTIEFIAIAIDNEDESKLAVIVDLIKTARKKGTKVVVIADEVSPMALHQLLQLGAEEFVPYPLPEGALSAAIDRMRTPPPVAPIATEGAALSTVGGGGGGRNGIILPVQGAAGGTGATTLAVNLAWELANVEKKGTQPRVILLDLSLQTGAVATYLDLPRRDAVFELLSATEMMDRDSFLQAMQIFNEKLTVLTAPPELLPLDFISNDDVERILNMARANFDYVIVDMPSTMVNWTETVLNAAEVYTVTLELDMRSAQNLLRIQRALRSEELPIEKLRYVLNRAPKGMDLAAKSRVKRMSESLSIDIQMQLMDGGKVVAEAGDHGLPLAESASKCPTRKEIVKLAQAIHESQKAKSLEAVN